MREFINRAFIKKEQCLAVSEWVDKHAITRMLFSPVCMASFYGLFLFMYEIVFLRETISAVHPFLIAWAAVVVMYNLVIRRNWTNLPGWKWLTWFSVACLISVFTNMQAGLVGNIKGWVLTVLPLFAFYPLCLSVPKQQRTKVLLKVFLGASIAIFVASLISLVLYVLHFGGTVKLFGLENFVGLRLYDERYLDSGVLLFGVFCDTNHAAMYAAAFSIYSIVLFFECRAGLFTKKWQNVLGMLYAAVNCIVQICYFPLANSRGGWLSLCVACVVVCFLRCYHANYGKYRKAINAIVSVVLAVVMTVGICGVLVGVRSGMTALSTSVVELMSKPPVTEPPVTEPPVTEPPVTEPAIKNELSMDVAWGDFSKGSESFGAGRIGYWIDALKQFTKRPIFGECPGNNQFYAQLYGYENKIAEGTALHNSYLDLLVDYGLVGFVLMIGFWINCLWIVLKRMANKKKQPGLSYYAVSMTLLMAAGVILLLSCAFISTTAMYFMMLVMTGYLVASDELLDVGTQK